MKNNIVAMSRIMIAGLFTLIIMLSGCTADDNQKTTPANTTEFGKMLDAIPYSFLESADIYYGNFGMAKAMHGVDDIDSFNNFYQADDEKRKAFLKASNETENVNPSWYSKSEDIASLTGIEVFAFDRAIIIGNAPPHISWLAQGNLNEKLISEKLSGLGYVKENYGEYSYYSIRDDYEMDITDPLGKQVMNSMNRVAVFDNTLIFSPVTGDVTGILDVLGGNDASIMNDDICRALAENLGDPLQAAFTTPERLVSSVPDPEQRRSFEFTIPTDWGILHGCNMAALGYRADGDKRYFDISLYYEDKSIAEADGKEIIKRINSYSLTLLRTPDTIVPFTDRFRPGEPVITGAPHGIILKISCEFINKDRYGVMMLIGGDGLPVRDLLFLAPNPQDYIKQLNQ